MQNGRRVNGYVGCSFIIINNINIYTHSLAFVTQKYHKPGTILYILLAYDDLKYLTYISLQTYPTNINTKKVTAFFLFLNNTLLVTL